MQVRFEEDAQAELFEAALYYDQQQLGLGDAFGQAVERAVGKVAADPSRFPIVIDGVQRCRVARFPYCVYFLALGEVLYVVAVAHHSRQPDYWKDRLS